MANTLKPIFILFLLFGFNSVLAQDSVKINKYLDSKIRTILEYHNITVDTVAKKYGGMDSLINNSQKTQWETLLNVDENKLIIANRKIKRMQVAYLNQSKYFFDSQVPVKFSGFLSEINEIYDRLNDKDFKEIVPVSLQGSESTSNFIDRPNLYNISPFDTTKYVLNVFFFQKLPHYFTENYKWSDTLITDNSVLLNFFTIRSISKNNLTLYFKTTIVALNHKRYNQSDSSNHKTKISIFESSTMTEGFIDIDPNTHFIYSIEGTTTRKIESNINENSNRNATFISTFALQNAIE